MTYINNGKSLQKVSEVSYTNTDNSIKIPVWKNPITGRDFNNDPEKDNHLFDVKKPYHSKDDIKTLNRILQKLESLGGSHGFKQDYQTNPNRKMKCTYHNGRNRKKDRKTFSAKHNDRNFNSLPDHIMKDKSENNIIWNWCGSNFSFEEGEQKFYEENFSEQLKYTNDKYEKNRHRERIKTMAEWRKTNQHCPEESILQIGKMGNHPDTEIMKQCFDEYMNWLNRWNEGHGNPFTILNWALHQDEMGGPHFHLRKVWICKDSKSGLVTTGQEEALKEADVELPYPSKPVNKTNNRKITFDSMCRKKWISVVKSHGFEIDDTPKPKNQVGMSLEEYQLNQDEIRNQIYDELYNLTKKNITVAEHISAWEDVIPAVDNFEKWMEEQCEAIRYTYEPEKRQQIAKMIVSAFANSEKSVIDEYKKQEKEFSKMLNGYNKNTIQGTQHIWGVNEICHILKSATAEQLENIAQVMKNSGFNDVAEWMEKSKWWKEFEYGKKVERQMEKELGIER